MADTKTSALTTLAGASIDAASDLIPIVDTSATTLKKVTPQALSLALKTEIHVASYATGGTGTSVDPWTGWDTAITWTAFTRYFFKAGYYGVTTAPNMAKNGIELIGEPGTYIYHTPTSVSDAFVMDAGGTATFTANAGTDVITFASDQGFVEGTQLVLTNSGGALPAGLSGGSYYFVKNLSGLTCQLSLTNGGAAVDITGAGTGTHTVSAYQWIHNCRVENISILGKTALITGTCTLSNGGTAVTGTGTAFLTEVPVGSTLTFAYGTTSARSYVVSAVTNDTSLTIDRAATSAESASAAKVCKTRNGFFLRGMRDGAFDRLSAKDVCLAGIYTEACVTNSLRLFQVSYHYPVQFTEFQCRPQYGIRFAGRNADWSTCWHVENAVIEGTQIYGIWLTATSYGTILAQGTSEGNKGVGIQIDSNNNSMLFFDLESNAGNGLVVNGKSYNSFFNIFNSDITLFNSPSSNNSIVGGYFQTLTVNSGCSRNFFTGHFVNGTYTESSGSVYGITNSASDFLSRLGINRRQTLSTSSTSPAPDCKLYERIEIAISATTTMGAPTNAVDGLIMEYCFNNNSGSNKTLAWNAIFVGGAGADLPLFCPTGRQTVVRFVYSSFWAKWYCTYATGQSRQGNATLAGGTVAVADTSVTANSIVLLAPKTAGGTPGTLTYTLSAGTGFTINSSSGTDTSVISYIIREP